MTSAVFATSKVTHILETYVHDFITYIAYTYGYQVKFTLYLVDENVIFLSWE
jgi:hypothetical protein